MRKIRVAHVITRLCQGGAQENTFHSVRLANQDRFEVDLISGPTQGREGSIESSNPGGGVSPSTASPGSCAPLPRCGICSACAT